MSIDGDEIRKNISKNIVKYREKASLSQKELAKRLNTSPSRVSNWEQGANCPTIDILFEVCKVLNVSINDIYGVYPDSKMTLSYNEQEYIKKSRFISAYHPDGISVIEYILEHEYSIAEKAKKEKAYIRELESRPAAIVDFQDHKDAAMRIYAYMHKIASAGVGFYFDDIPTDTIKAPYCENADFIIGVSGDSMEPTYSDGDLVYVQKQQGVEVGEIGIFIVNGECFIKEACEDGLKSHNSKYKLIPGTEHINCVGKVLGKVKTN